LRPFEITVLSGKGGTGKTTFCASFIALSHPDTVFTDLDVDASNLPILLQSSEIYREAFSGMDLAVIDHEKCTGCGTCRRSCRFGAIDEDIRIIKDRCEGCGVCRIVCPHEAVELIPRKDGDLLVSDTRFGTLVHSDLRPGGEGSGKLVSLIRRKARSLAEEEGKPLIISDGPPGLGCPVISSLTGSDLAVIVTEPSISGRTDLIRILDLCDHFNVQSAVIINKYDIDTNASRQMETIVTGSGSEVIGKVPFDMSVFDSLSEGKTIVEFDGCPISVKLIEIWDRIRDRYINASPDVS
jgi:MinD superfamily P-loop ATPase